METDYTEVKEKEQAKNTLLHTIKVAMKRCKWRQADLVRASGVNQATISRFLNGEEERQDLGNIFRILNALDLIKSDPDHASERQDRVYSYHPDHRKLHDDLELVLKSDNTEAVSVLTDVMKGVLAMIGKETEFTKLMRQVKEYLERQESSTGGGISADPAPAKKEPR